MQKLDIRTHVHALCFKLCSKIQSFQIDPSTEGSGCPRQGQGLYQCILYAQGLPEPKPGDQWLNSMELGIKSPETGVPV